jgi:hypothetical protein
VIDTIPTTYYHTQRGPWYLLVYAISFSPLIAAYIVRDNLAIATLFLFAAIAISTVAASVQHLTVTDEGDRLRIKFGPIPLFQRSVRYEDIEHVEVSRTSSMDGWGVQLSHRGGWVWNIWGRDCVLIERRRGWKLWLGTDEADELFQFLKGKIMANAN